MPELRTPLFLLDVELDSGTQYASSRTVNSPSRTYEPFVISYGSIETAIPSPCGIPIVSDGVFTLAEEPETRKWRDLFSHETPRRRRVKVWALFEGESIAYLDPDASPLVPRPPFFSGEIVDAIFKPDRSIEITVRDLTYAWIDEPIPAMITQSILPGLDPRYEGQFLPIVAGEVRTPGIDDSPRTVTLLGQIALPRMGFGVDGDRWGIAAHPCAGFRVFRREETVFDESPTASPPITATREQWVEVDPGEYTTSLYAVEAFNLSMNWTVIDFFVEQPEGTELRADIDGIDYRGGWGSLDAFGYDHFSSPPTTVGGGDGSALRNPIDFFINMTFMVMAKAGVSGGDGSVFDLVDISALREKFGGGLDSPPTPIYCDGAITQPITCREWLGQFLTSFNLDMWQKRNGKISLAYVDEEDPDRLVYTETSHILKETFQERLPSKHVNQIQYQYQLNSAEETFGMIEIIDTSDQEVVAIDEVSGSPSTAIPKVEKDVVDLLFVRDPDTALVVVSHRVQFQGLGSFEQQWDMPTPEVPVSLEPSSLIGVTHEMGLEIGGYVNREVKVLSRVDNLDTLRSTVRGILRSPQEVFKGGMLPFSYPGGPVYYGDTCADAPFHKEPAYGGTGPWTFTLFSGTLPPGSTLDPDTGVIDSTFFTVPGIYKPVIKMVDGTGKVGMIKLKFDLTECLAILACPVEQPVVGELYSFIFLTSGGRPGAQLWDIYAGALPPGLVLEEFSGAIFGYPTALSSDPFTIRVRDQALHNPQEALITCSFTGGENGVTRIVWGYGTPSNAKQFFILPPERDTLYRSKYSSGYPAWTTMALPYASTWSELAFYFNFLIYSEEAKAAMKRGFGSSDNAWVDVPTPAPLHGSYRVVQPDNFAGSGSPIPGWAIGDDNNLHGDNNDVTLDFNTFTQSIPAGTWNYLYNASGGVLLDNNEVVLLVGNAATVQRWDSDGHGDTDWVSISCTSRDWRMVAGPANRFVMVVVGVGGIMRTFDEAATFADIDLSAVPDWEAVDPRIVFCPNLNESGTSGTFVIIGGKRGSATDVIGLKYSTIGGSPFFALSAPFYLGVPDLGASNKWTDLDVSRLSGNGIIIVGNKGTTNADLTMITNPGGTNDYDNWTEKTLADAPF